MIIVLKVLASLICLSRGVDSARTYAAEHPEMNHGNRVGAAIGETLISLGILGAIWL